MDEVRLEDFIASFISVMEGYGFVPYVAEWQGETLWFCMDDTRLVGVLTDVPIAEVEFFHPDLKLAYRVTFVTDVGDEEEIIANWVCFRNDDDLPTRHIDLAIYETLLAVGR